MMYRHKQVALLTALGLTLLSLGFAQREVSIAVTADPETLDPHASATSNTITIVNNLYDKLVERNPDNMSIVPDLAESWERIDDTTFVFNLREGVTFHNGEPLTASDVVFSFERMRQPGLEDIGKYVEPLIESVEATDDYTVQFNLLEAYGPFLNRMPSFYIVPEDYIREVGDDTFAREPIGSGPYTLVEWIPDDHISFVAYEDYWRGAPEVKEVTYRPIPEAATRIAALLSGQVDVIDQVNLPDVDLLERNNNVRIEAVTDNRFYFYAINSSEPPFDDLRVRQALSHAVDWDTVLGIYDGFAFHVDVPALPSDFGYSQYIDSLESLIPEYDPERARELLAEAGYEDGLSITIETPLDRYPRDAELAQALAEQLSEVGIDATVQTYEWGVYLSDVWPGNIEDIGFFSMGNPLFDPDQLFTVHFDPEGNSRYYSTPELTELGNRGRVTTDPEERAQIYGEFMTYIMEQVPYLWSHGVRAVYGVNEEIAWTPRADSRIFADEMSFK